MISLMPLPYAPDALQPHMSAETFEYHHGRHFAGYVNTVNRLTGGTAHEGKDLETIIADAAETGDTALFNAAGQAWNHGFFWASMAPTDARRPAARLADAIERDFGSHDAMVEQFIKQGAGHFGSGWVWLASAGDGELAITTTHDGMPVWVGRPLTPLLVCDLWEHGYYIDWRNDRPAFLKAYITKLGNWIFAEQQYHAAGANNAPQRWRYPD